MCGFQWNLSNTWNSGYLILLFQRIMFEVFKIYFSMIKDWLKKTIWIEIKPYEYKIYKRINIIKW